MRHLYQSVDAVVIPSRGEGWGRPHMEAMAMGLPVIATNWSGTTAFMTDANSYPLSIDGLVPVHRQFRLPGHQWAQPNVTHLRQLMRTVYTDQATAKAKGRRAQQDMRQYGIPQVGAQVSARLESIKTRLKRQNNPRGCLWAAASRLRPTVLGHLWQLFAAILLVTVGLWYGVCWRLRIRRRLFCLHMCSLVVLLATVLAVFVSGYARFCPFQPSPYLWPDFLFFGNVSAAQIWESRAPPATHPVCAQPSIPRQFG